MPISFEEHIDADPALVWRHLTTPALMQDWMPGVSDIRTVDDGPLTLESTITFQARGAERRSLVVEFRPDECFALRSTQGPITAIYRYVLSSDDRGTRVTVAIDCAGRGPARMIVPIIRAMVRRAESSHLSNLEHAVMAQKG